MHDILWTTDDNFKSTCHYESYLKIPLVKGECGRFTRRFRIQNRSWFLFRKSNIY